MIHWRLPATSEDRCNWRKPNPSNCSSQKDFAPAKSKSLPEGRLENCPFQTRVLWAFARSCRGETRDPDWLTHHTRLKAAQWINLNRHVVEFTTLPKRATDRIMAGRNHKSDATREQVPARGI